jgi:nucleoid DNA-binding protein
MNKSELAKKVARKRSIETGPAADRLDRAVNKILQALRRGESARLPGLGTITPGDKEWTFDQERDER